MEGNNDDWIFSGKCHSFNVKNIIYTALKETLKKKVFYCDSLLSLHSFFLSTNQRVKEKGDLESSKSFFDIEKPSCWRMFTHKRQLNDAMELRLDQPRRASLFMVLTLPDGKKQLILKGFL